MEELKKYMVTAGLVITNLIIFLVVDFTGGAGNTQHMVDCGAAYTPLIINDGEWYRLVTAIFLHFSIEHLLNNMVVLAVLGERLEKVMSRFSYLLVYFIAGIGGNLISMGIEISTGRYAVSAGASGAVFGMMGAVLYIMIRNHGKMLDLSIKRMLLMLALSIYLGFADAGVNSTAHLGGLACGFMAAVLLYHPHVSRRTAQ